MKKERIVKWGFWILLIGLVSIFGAQAFLYIFYGDTWLDETEYLYVGQQIYERDLTLYDEIWSRVPPVLHYIYGFSQTLIGPSFEMGRLFSLIFSSLLLITIFFTVKKMTQSRYAGLLAIALIMLNQKALSFLLRVSPYPLSLLLLSLSIGVLATKMRDTIKFPLAFFFASLLMMTRMNLFPYAMVLLVYMLIVAQDKIKTTVRAMGVSLVTITAVMIKFLIINGKNTLLGIFAPFTIYLYPELFYKNVAKEPWLSVVYESFKAMNNLKVILIFLIPLTWWFVQHYIQRRKEHQQHKKKVQAPTTSRSTWQSAWFVLWMREHHLIIFLIASFFAIFIPHFWANDVYVFYSLPPLVIVVSVGLHALIRMIENAFTKKIVIAWIAGSLVLSLSLFTVLDFSNPLSGDSDILRAKRSGEIIANLTEPDATVFIADNEIAQLLTANRKTFPPMTERYYLFSDDNNTNFLRATNRFNMEILNEHLENESDYVLIQSNRGWLKLNKPPILENVTKNIQSQLDNQYQHVVDIPNALPKRYAYGNGTLSLYKRVKKAKENKKL